MLPMMMQGQPAAPLGYVERCFAFLRAELGIVEGLSLTWNQFVQALRTSWEDNTARPTGWRSTSTHLSMRLDSLRAARKSFQRRYALLSTTQKRAADELLVPVLVSF